MKIEFPDKWFTKEELENTPKRYKRFLEEWLVKDQTFELTTFENTEKYDEMIIIKCSTQSMCAHHLTIIDLPEVYIAYIPKDRIVGLSKIPKVVNKFAHQPQLQEKLTMQIANYLQEKLEPLGVAVLIRGKHFCTVARGVKSDGWMKTSAMKGVFLSPPPGKLPKEELLNMIKWKE